MKYRDVVLVRAVQGGPVLNALVLRCSIGVPSRGGKPILGSDGKPVEAEELLDVLVLPDETQAKVYTSGAPAEIMYSVRPGSEADAPGWAGPLSIVAPFPFAYSAEEVKHILEVRQAIDRNTGAAPSSADLDATAEEQKAKAATLADPSAGSAPSPTGAEPGSSQDQPTSQVSTTEESSESAPSGDSAAVTESQPDVAGLPGAPAQA